jgi:hypothetical protein
VNTCATGVTYDEKLLRTYKSATRLLVNALPGIVQHRFFWTIGDDRSMEIDPGEDGCVDEAELSEAIQAV